jgi:AcrR family transcriptional regulator
MLSSLSSSPRLSQEQRSGAMRERLIRATVECIAEKGYGGATTAEISARAGVSSGARVHHFKAKLDLVIAAVLFTYEEATVESVRAAVSPAAAKDPLRAFLEDTYSFYSGSRFLIQHEVINAARTTPELMQAMQPAANAFRAAVNAAWLQAFARAGHSADWSEMAMELTVVLVRGLALGSSLRGRERDAEVLRLWMIVMSSHPDTGISSGKRAPATR